MFPGDVSTLYFFLVEKGTKQDKLEHYPSFVTDNCEEDCDYDILAQSTRDLHIFLNNVVLRGQPLY